MSAPVQCPKCNGSGEMHHVEDGVTVAQQCSGCDGVGSLGTIEASNRLAELDETKRLLASAIRQYHQLVLRHEDERNGTLGERQRSLNMLHAVVVDLEKMAEEKRRLRRLYRRRITRLQGLLRERKTLAGWLGAKLRRVGAR